MKNTEQIVDTSNHNKGEGTLKSYSVGFILSLLLTAVAYFLVESHNKRGNYSHAFLIIAILILAIIQLFVQLIYFLHLSKESRLRWNLMMLLFAAMVVFIIVGGSLWIMYNLSYRMTPAQTNTYINNQDGL